MRLKSNLICKLCNTAVPFPTEQQIATGCECCNVQVVWNVTHDYPISISVLDSRGTPEKGWDDLTSEEIREIEGGGRRI